MGGDDISGSTDNAGVCGVSATGQCPLFEEGSDLFLLRFLHSSEVALCRFAERPLVVGEIVVAPSRYGKDLARIVGPVRSSMRELGSVVAVERIATPADTAEYERNLDFESKALTTCRQKVDHHELQMKVLSTHLLPQENKLLVFFTADGRVDFRELVRDLVGTYRMRIELRQIGVRDETRLVGGVGICGRVLCCHAFPEQMCSVSIKMAKEQNLSLGSMKVSGPCGRLLCCLSYEYGFYTSEKGKYPHQGATVRGPSTSYVVTDVNMIAARVVLLAKGGGLLTVSLEQLDYDSETRSWSTSVPDQTTDS